MDKFSRHLTENTYICGMNFSSYLRNRALNRALEQFLSDRPLSKMPNLQRINSILIILDENDKSIVKNIESSAKSLFGTNRCGFVILCNQMSDTILQSDLFNEITPKDFGFMSVLKPDKHDYLHGGKERRHQRLPLHLAQVGLQDLFPPKQAPANLRPDHRESASHRPCFKHSCPAQLPESIGRATTPKSITL